MHNTRSSSPRLLTRCHVSIKFVVKKKEYQKSLNTEPRSHESPVIDGCDYSMVLKNIYQSSVLKGDAGKPSALYKQASGFIAQAYLTATGTGTFLQLTITLLPVIIASAQ